MTRQEAVQQVSERWKRQHLDPQSHPLIFSSDVDITMGCVCSGILIHSKNCPCYEPTQNELLNAELAEQFRDGSLSYEEYDA